MQGINAEPLTQIVMDSVMDIPVFGVSVTLFKYLYISVLMRVVYVNRDG